MVEDNTPTVNTKPRKPTRHMRLRIENMKRLRALGAKKKAERDKAEKVTVVDANETSAKAVEQPTTSSTKVTPTTEVKARKPKAKKTATLAKPPVPKAKFRKRQQHKSWLPSHLFHAKRAHMTPPSAPLWRFAIPLTPTQKCYRPTHRAGWERGCVAWDTSYMATIGLDGRKDSITNVLKGLGIDVEAVTGFNGKWKAGSRVREAWAYEQESKKPIAPVDIIWSSSSSSTDKTTTADAEAKRKRTLFMRVHPSAFFQLWEEVIRLAKVAKPAVSVEDLRFEIGSIEITGPGSTEALSGALWPVQDQAEGSVAKTWTSLAGLTNASLLPDGALLALNVQDPRLHHPPRTIKLPKTQDEQEILIHLAANWPLDSMPDLPSSDLFTRTSRLRNSKFPSQKAINRRKSLAAPGTYPETLATDPKIPVILYTSPPSISRSQKHSSNSHWTLVAPWKRIRPIWYSIMYYPLSTGQQPRFGGLNEKRQLAFEARVPWLPADFPGTDAGWSWEVLERRRRWEEWHKRPKGKRVSWEKVDLGSGVKGEVGEGWACDWRFLLGEKQVAGSVDVSDGASESATAAQEPAQSVKGEKPIPPSKPEKLMQMSETTAFQLLKNPLANPQNLEGQLVTVRLTLVTKGVPQVCARIYRLPFSSTNTELRKAWLDIQSTTQLGPKKKKQQTTLPKTAKDAPQHVVQQRLAASLLEPPRAGSDDYPSCPPAEDLIGFVTTGNFNLAQGKGTGIGSLLVGKVIDDARINGDASRLCVVRNSGESVGRLARWEVV